MKKLNLFALICTLLSIGFLSCGGDEEPEVKELPDELWEIQLNGEDFSVPAANNDAYYSAFNGDFQIVGTLSRSTEERIVFTFNVDNGAPFVDGQSLDMGPGSGNSILYFDTRSNNDYSTLDLDGEGTFTVDQYIEGEFRNFLSGSVTGTLFNPMDSTSVTVTGSVASKTF